MLRNLLFTGLSCLLLNTITASQPHEDARLKFNKLHNDKSNHKKSRKEKVIDQIKKDNDFIKDKTIRQAKWEKMSFSPFSFYRATASQFYKDIKHEKINSPKKWNDHKLFTWIQGDFHCQNIGFFDNEGELVFGLNDFDEAWVGAFWLDLLRFSTSIHLMANDNTLVAYDANQKNELVRTFLSSYMEQLKNKEKPALTKVIAKRIAKLKTKKSLETLHKKWTVFQNNKRMFNRDNPKLGELGPKEEKLLKLYYQTYLATVLKRFEENTEHFKIKDAVNRLYSGLGSMGVTKIYALIEGNTNSPDDDIILEIKEQKASVLLDHKFALDSKYYTKWYQNHAEHNLHAQSQMATDSEPYTGLMETGKKSYLVRRISPWKWGFEADKFDTYEKFEQFVKQCGIELALAHKMSGTVDRKKTFLKNSDKFFKKNKDFEKKLIKIAEQYTEQVKKDFDYFIEAVANNQL
jgi:uncharacterized protein (DUF2252 family)